VRRIFHFRSFAAGQPKAAVPTFSQLGPLEQRLLEALWERRSATVRELVEDGCQHLAYTTVMTTLDRLFKKNLLTREAEGRAFRYSPSFSREELHRDAAGAAFRQLLQASPAASLPLSYLVEIVSERDTELLDDLGKLIEAKRRELRSERKKNLSGGSNGEGKP